MKCTPLFLLLLVLQAIHAQEKKASFEGRILYELKVFSEKEPTRVEVLFSYPFIRVNPMSDNNLTFGSGIYMIFELDSARVFSVRPEEKSYRVTRLIREEGADTLPAQKKVLGYVTQLYKSGMQNSGGVSLLLNSGQLSRYVSEDLYFSLPGQLDNLPEFFFIRQDRLVLSANLTMNVPAGDLPEQNEKKALYFSMEAIALEKKKINSSHFQLPPGFRETKRFSYGVEAREDTISRKADENSSGKLKDSSLTMWETPAGKEPAKTSTPSPSAKQKKARKGTLRKPD